MELTNQHIAHRLNRRAEIERENLRMNELERRATPLFYAVFCAAAAVLLWLVTEDYRDVAKHRLDTMADKQQYDRISDTLARCANGSVVSFDGAPLTCKHKKLELINGKRN